MLFIQSYEIIICGIELTLHTLIRSFFLDSSSISIAFPLPFKDITANICILTSFKPKVFS